MKTILKYSKKALSVFMAVMMVMTAWVFVDPASLKSEAASTKAASVTAGDLKFIVPEAIYLYPNAQSDSAATATPFQYYINNTSANAIKEGKDTTGYIFYSYATASNATLSYRFLNNDMTSVLSGGSITLSATSSLGTSKTINITAGTSPSLGASVSGCYVEWTLSFTDTTDNVAKKAYAYTYVYKPYIVPVGGAIRVANTDGISSSYHPYCQSLTWMTGMHSIGGSASYYAKKTEDGLSAFMTSGDYAYDGDTQISAAFGKRQVDCYNAANKYDGSGNWKFSFINASSSTFTNDVNNKGVSDWITTSSGTGTFSKKSFDYGDRSGGDDNQLRYIYCGAYGNICIDTSRYTNLKNIPNLGIGSMLTDNENANQGNWYMADASGYTNGRDSGPETSSSNIDSGKRYSYWNYRIAYLGNSQTDTSLTDTWDEEGIHYAGPWPRTLLGSTTTQGGTYTYSFRSWNESYKGGEYQMNSVLVDLKATYYNKANLRDAVYNATAKFPALGVNGLDECGKPKSTYFDSDTNYKWTAFQTAYQKAVRVLGSVDMNTGISDNPNTLATNLTNALNALCTKVTFDGNGGSSTAAYTTYNCSTCDSSYNVVGADATGHSCTVYSIVTDATCTAEGVGKYTCENCTYSYEVPIAAKGHTYVATVSQTGNCGVPEITTQKCSACNDEYTEITAVATGNHTFDTWVTISEATPTSAGQEKGTCSVCGATTLVTVPPTGAHVFVEDEHSYVAPTCTEKGTRYFNCTTHTDCEANYTEDVAPLGHDCIITKIDATCEGEGSTSMYCTRCNTDVLTKVIPAIGHSYEKNAMVEATCKTDGYITYTCSKCNKTYTDTIAKNTARHEYEVGSVTVASCTTPEYTSYVCKDCGATYLLKTGDALGHNYGSDYETDIAATCTVDGSKSKHCSRCDATTDVTVIPATNHTEDTRTVQSATCTQGGVEETYCTVCSLVISTSTVDPVAHTYSTVSFVPTEAQDTLSAYTYEKCDVCGIVKENSVVITDPVGHDYVETDRTEPTNDVAGSITFTCSHCNDVKIEVLPAQGHNFVETSRTDATCDAEGNVVYTCNKHADCGMTYTEILPKLAHTYTTVTTDPTCTTDGLSTVKCTGCSLVLDEIVLPAKGHTIEVESFDQATCEADGALVYACKDCDYKTTTTIPATGHDYVESSRVDSDCTYEGIVYYQCSRCTSTTTKTIEVKPDKHDFTTTTTEATCFTDSFTTYVCNTCGYSYTIKNPGTALTHNFVLKSHQDPTCTEDGYDIKTCTLCELEKTVTLLATGHDFTEWEIIAEPTCDQTGTAKRVCKNDPAHIEYTTLPATEEHIYVQTVVEPTCTQNGFTIFVCKDCGKTFQDLYVDALGHDYDEGVYQEATCTTDAGTLYTCTREGCSASEADHTMFVKEADALGHVMGNWYFVKHPTIANAYAKKVDCTRDKCKYYEYELAENGSVNEYYKVVYINNYYTADDGYYTAGDGTKLADTSKYKNETLYIDYVLKGEASTYPTQPAKTPYRAPTTEFGAYSFTGWSLDQAGQSLDSVTKNITAHAMFTGKEIYYKVSFYNYDGTFVMEHQHVLHGHAATAPSTNPTKASTYTTNYTFSGWDIDISAIYSNVNAVAQYSESTRTYKIVYHDWNGNVLGSETFNYGQAPTSAPTGLTRASDGKYSYKFSGWTLSNGAAYNVNRLTVPSLKYADYDPANESSTTLSDAQKGIVNVYAAYKTTEITYTVKLSIADTKGNILNGAAVKVYDSNNYLVKDLTVNGTHEITLDLIYDSYVVKVSYNDQTIEVKISAETLASNSAVVPVTFEINEATPVEEECGCICHIPLIGKIYTFFKNLFAKLTGNNTPCCPDHV